MAQREAAQAQHDAALDAFYKLRVQEVDARYTDTASTFLARFQSATASLGPDEWIKLDCAHDNVALLKAVLADPQADKICSLRWHYNGEEDVNSIVHMLIDYCPELASLDVRFKHWCAFDVVSSVLEHPRNKVKVLKTPQYAGRDLTRFFAALGHSQVSVLTLDKDSSFEFARGLRKYLAKGMVVRLTVGMNYRQAPSKMMRSLAKCTCLVDLSMYECEFSQPTAFARLPKSITKLKLEKCTFVSGFKWSFLADSSVRKLDFLLVKGVEGNKLGRALVVHLRAKGLDRLRFYHCDFVDETLAVVGVELGQIQRLDFECSNLNDASFALIALTLRSPNIETTELRLAYTIPTARSIETLLVPALRQLSLLAFSAECEAAAKRVNIAFRHRRALFALMQGQQVRRKSPCPLRRLPVEMFRLVGEVLL